MSEHNMEHMRYLEQVVANDVQCLRDKERTYQGSWKREGGRSAWFMIRRKIDRLLVMMARPKEPVGFNMESVDDTIAAILDSNYIPGVKVAGEGSSFAQIKLPTNSKQTAETLKYVRDSYLAENIFALIREDPSGDDGSVLAEIRDLRRYLTLAEAEMMARGVVSLAEIKKYSAKEPYEV